MVSVKMMSDFEYKGFLLIQVNCNIKWFKSNLKALLKNRFSNVIERMHRETADQRLQNA